MRSEKRLRVIVVDDQQAVCDVVSDTIRFAGHEIVGTARDGVEAITCAEELRPDLVVMDILMPRMNGVEAMRAMLEAGTARRVMLMSGEFHSTGMTVDDVLRSGAAAFLEKPFDVNTLFNLLDQWSEETDGEGKSARKRQTDSASKSG
jgi:two-component system, chemotaxis family, chemotaxis protein CheY